MIYLTLGIQQNIINKYNDEQIQKLKEFPIYEIHKCLWGIGQPKEKTKNLK